MLGVCILVAYLGGRGKQALFEGLVHGILGRELRVFPAEVHDESFQSLCQLFVAGSLRPRQKRQTPTKKVENEKGFRQVSSEKKEPDIWWGGELKTSRASVRTINTVEGVAFWGGYRHPNGLHR